MSDKPTERGKFPADTTTPREFNPLIRYVRHFDTCPHSGESMSSDSDCDCGLLEVLAGAAPAVEACTDCEKAAKHAYSDGTTSGFFHDKCAKHRAGEAPPQEEK